MGVASLVAMLSLGVGLQELASKRLSRSGLFDAVFVSSRMSQRGFGRPTRPDPATASPAKSLDEEARRKIAGLANVVEVYPEIRFPTEIQFEGKPFSTTVAGIPASAKSDGAFDGMKGAFFSGPNVDEAILQIEFARDLSTQPDSLLGKDLALRYAERQPLPAEPSAGKSKAAAGGATPHSGESDLSPGLPMLSKSIPRFASPRKSSSKASRSRPPSPAFLHPLNPMARSMA